LEVVPLNDKRMSLRGDMTQQTQGSDELVNRIAIFSTKHTSSAVSTTPCETVNRILVSAMNHSSVTIVLPFEQFAEKRKLVIRCESTRN
jgi:hypothetical protein